MKNRLCKKEANYQKQNSVKSTTNKFIRTGNDHQEKSVCFIQLCVLCNCVFYLDINVRFLPERTYGFKSANFATFFGSNV